MKSQQGSGTLAAITALLFLGLSSLLGWQRMMAAWRERIYDEQFHLTAFHQAESALSWALTQHWQGDGAQEDECRRPNGESFRACLVMAGPDNNWTLRAEGGVEAGRAPAMVLYRRVALRPAESAEKDMAGRRRYTVAPLPQGWLDYDPG